MFDQLFEHPFTLARHRTGPLVEERVAFLTHLASQGYAWRGLRRKARALLAIAHTLGLATLPRKALTLVEVQRKVANQHHLLPLAVRWFQFMGRLQQRPAPLTPCERKIKAFADYMAHEEGFRPETIRRRCGVITQFLNRVDIQSDSLHKITPGQIDVAIQKLLDPGGYSRKTVQAFADALRTFFRFAGARGWCRKGLAASIRTPRVFAQTSLPLGPSWDDVRRLLTMTGGDQRHNIRARPMLMLLAIYGLRAGEVCCLRLEDFDWEHEVFRVVSSKTGRVRTYPLTRTVGDAILRYLQEVRPRSSHREVFLSLKAPFRPGRSTSLWHVVARRLRSLHVSLPHYGSHALRHACATRLLAAGLSLKEIGDQLGHSDPNSTRIYAKVDLAGLREVADFDMGGVL
jgi:site-specific recombinase XerD